VGEGAKRVMTGHDRAYSAPGKTGQVHLDQHDSMGAGIPQGLTAVRPNEPFDGAVETLAVAVAAAWTSAASVASSGERRWQQARPTTKRSGQVASPCARARAEQRPASQFCRWSARVAEGVCITACRQSASPNGDDRGLRPERLSHAAPGGRPARRWWQRRIRYGRSWQGCYVIANEFATYGLATQSSMRIIRNKRPALSGTHA